MQKDCFNGQNEKLIQKQENDYDKTNIVLIWSQD